MLTVLQDGEERNLTVTPVEQDGRKRLGIYVREALLVGTVTYYDLSPAPWRPGDTVSATPVEICSLWKPAPH